jgi:ATP-dependent helicase/nuclease subunit B
VLDFKSSAREFNTLKFHNGIQLQLPAYLSMLRSLKNPQQRLGASKLIPAGLFYVALRGYDDPAKNRNDVLKDQSLARREAYQHTGRFDVMALEFLDSQGAADQFNYSFNADRSVSRRTSDPMDGESFIALLDAVDARLRDFGERIFAGAAKVDPYRKNSETACDYCEYRPVCRIDPWTHEYRALEPLPTE